MIDERHFGKGAVPEPEDQRDLIFEFILPDLFGLGEDEQEPEVDWDKGYSVEEDLGFSLPFKNQGSSQSCVGQAISYYVGVLDYLERKQYQEVSAKSIYSQIFLEPDGGAYIRDGMDLVTDWGSLREAKVPSYNDGRPPRESFMQDTSWKSRKLNKLAEILQAKEYRKIAAWNDIDRFALAIQKNKGVVSGLSATSNGTWNTLEPEPGDVIDYEHGLYFGGFGRDKKGKYLLTPNNWGNRFQGKWQKIRQIWFEVNKMFNPWTLTDKPNMQKFPVQDNKLYLLVGDDTKTQKLAMGYRGKLMVYNRKIDTMLNSASRSGKWEPPIPLGPSQWGSVEKIDGKGNPLPQ